MLEQNVAELRALAHPLRLRMLELFAESPRTTKQLAELLGQPQTRLYHHVNALERAGLIQLRESRANRGTVERWYGAESRFASGGRSTGSSAAAGVALTVLDQSRHEIAAALGDESPERPRPVVVRAVIVGSARVQETVRRRLSDFLAALEGEVKALKKVAKKRARGASAGAETDQRWALTIGLAPVASPTPGASAVAGEAPTSRKRR